jgi:hypothetical protein
VEERAISRWPTCNVALKIPLGKVNGRSGPGWTVEAGNRAGPILLAAPLAGWCNWQHTSLWIWELGFESLPGSFRAAGRRRREKGRRYLPDRPPAVPRPGPQALARLPRVSSRSWPWSPNLWTLASDLVQFCNKAVLFRRREGPEDGGVSGMSTVSCPSDHTPTLEALAASQKDLLTHDQLLAAGLTRQAIAKRVASGTLHRRHRGVYSLGPAPLSREAEFLAAVLAAGPGAVLSHASAAELHGTTRHRAPLIAVLSPRKRSLEGVRVHRYRTLDPRDVTTCHGIPVTTIHRTFVDLADENTPQELAAYMHEAAFRGRLVEPAIRDAMQRAKGRRNLHVVDEALAIHAAGGAGFKSRAEKAYHALMRDEDPVVNTKLLGFEVDFHWPGQRLVVEVDGPGHQRPRAKRDDARRDQRLRAAGYTVVRFTDEDVYERPNEVRRRTVAALASSLRTRRAA